MSELLLFLTAIALGMVLRALYYLLSLLAKSTSLKAMRYITDVVWCAVAFLAFAALTMFLGGGAFETFTVIGILAGLGIGSLVFMTLSTAKTEEPEKTNVKK